MTTGNPELKALLKQARARAAESLARDPVWRALQQLEAETPPGSAASGLAGTSRSELQAALGGNRYLAVLGKIDEALALLAEAEAAQAARPTVAAPAAPAGRPGDDLTRIRGLKPAMAATLARLGVGTYRQIASWTAADVRAVAAALGPDAAIHRQGWIEQAAMLAARAPAPAPTPASAPTSAPAPARVSATAPPATASSMQPGPAGPASSAEAGIDGLVTSALRGIIAGVPAVPAAVGGEGASTRDPRPFEVAAGKALPDAAHEAARLAAQRLAAPRLDPAPTPTPMPASRMAIEPGPPEPPPPAADDDLGQIAGIDGATQRRLRTLGIRRFADIAAWTAADVVAHEVGLLQPLRIRREGWIEQAAMLAQGRTTDYARRRRCGHFACLATAPDPSPWQRRPLAQTWAAAPVPVPPPDAPPAPVRVTAALAIPAEAFASVRSDDAAPVETTPTPMQPDATILQQQGGEAADSAAPQAPPAPLPTLVVPGLDFVASIPRAALAAVSAPLPPQPTPPPQPSAPTAPPENVDPRTAPADRLETCGSDLAPGIAIALAAAAATSLTLGDRSAESPPRRRRLADSVTSLPPLASNVDLRQWRNDNAAEFAAVSDRVARAAPPPDEEPATAPDQSAGHDDSPTDSALLHDDEAEVVIVARGGEADEEPAWATDAPAPHAAEATPADLIKARTRQRQSRGDGDDDEPDVIGAAGRFEEASVEIVVHDPDGLASIDRSRGAAAKPDDRGTGGLRRLVKALKGDRDGA